MRHTSHASLCLLLICAFSSAQADTLYKCSEKGSDSVLFTNQRVSGKNCVVLSNTPSSSSSTSSGPRPRASGTPTPSDFPRVSTDTQKERDTNRRTILEQELAIEQRNLDEARKSGNTAKVQLHERNILALQKEISNLK